MKKPVLLFACSFIAALAAVFQVRAQPAPGGGNPFLNDAGTNSIDTLHNTITKQVYVYVKGNYNMSIKFNGNGTGQHTNWKFKWHAKDAQTIELSRLGLDGAPDGQKTTLTFSADYTTFTGTDFDGITKVSGHQAAAQ